MNCVLMVNVLNPGPTPTKKTKQKQPPAVLLLIDDYDSISWCRGVRLVAHQTGLKRWTSQTMQQVLYRSKVRTGLTNSNKPVPVASGLLATLVHAWRHGLLQGSVSCRAVVSGSSHFLELLNAKWAVCVQRSQLGICSTWICFPDQSLSV